MATSDDNRPWQDIADFHDELRRLRNDAGADLRRLAEHDAVPIGKSRLGELLGPNSRTLIERPVFIRLLDAIYEIAEANQCLAMLPDRSEVLARYDRLAASTRPSSSPRPVTVVPGVQPVPAGRAIEVLIDAAQVEVRRAEDSQTLVRRAHGGIGFRLPLMLNEFERRLLRVVHAEDQPFVPAAGDEDWPGDWHTKVGTELGAHFLGDDVGRVLAGYLARAAHQGGRHLLAVHVTDPLLAALPWESAVVPGTGTPWCRADAVQLYRPVDTARPAAEVSIASPLKILALIVNPPVRQGLSAFHEHGLEAVDESVNAARRENLARVYEPAWGDVGSLQQELAERRHHVFYLTCSADRKGLLLETKDGRVESVSPRRLAGDVFGSLPAVPLVLLRAYATEPGVPIWPMIHELVDRLCAAGTLGVLVIPAGMTHQEVVRFTARMFTDAAKNPAQSILDVVSHARRAELGNSHGQPRVYLTRSGVDTIVVDQSRHEDPPRSQLRVAALPVRATSDFVGRRGELRTVLSTLLGPRPAIVVTGIGGIGKSTLAAQALRVLGPARAGLVAAPQGEPSVETIMAAIVSRLHIWTLDHAGGDFERDLVLLGETQMSWQERLDRLAERVLPNLPVTLLLDGFEDNQDGDRQVGEADLAEFLGRWVRLADTARLLLTTRYPLALPDEIRPYVTTLRLGPLTMVEARRLAWRLPALDSLDNDQLRSAVAKVGGHPRTLEYFDALVRGLHAKFPDVEARLRAALKDRLLLEDTDGWMAADFSDPDHVLAESIALTSGDVLLNSLVDRLDTAPDARELLVRASVYRQPVDDSGLQAMISAGGPESRYRRARTTLSDLGLLAEIPALESAPDRQRWLVHRWTAADLLRRADADTVRSAHERAAAYWLTVADQSAPEDPNRPVVAWLEEAHHLLAAGRLVESAWATDLACSQLDVRGGHAWVMQICRDAVTELRGKGEAEAVVVSRLGTTAARLAGYQESAECLARAVQIRRELGLREGLASNLENIATLRQLHGAYGEALDLYRESLAAFGPADDQSALATVSYNLGNLARRRGDLDSAQLLYERGLEVSQQPTLSLELRDRTVEDLAGLTAEPAPIDVDQPTAWLGDWDLGRVEQATRGNVRLTRNLILRYRGEYPAAEQRLIPVHLRHAVAVRSVSIASGHCNLGVVAQVRGDYEQAAQHYRTAYDIYDELHDLGRLPIVLHNQATLAQLREDRATARARYDLSQSMFSDINDLAGFSTGRHNIGALAQAEGDADLARHLYAESDRLYTRLRDPIGRAGIAVNLGVLAADRGDHDAADDLYRAAWRVFAAAGDALSCAVTASNIGRLRAGTGEPAEGVRWSLYSLLARSQYGLTEATIDAETLAEQRRMLGRREFGRILRDLLAEQAALELDLLVNERQR